MAPPKQVSWATAAQLLGYTNVYPLGTLLSMKTKDAGLRIRVDRELREAFVAVCRAQDKPAAQVLREFMREYVERNPAVSGETRNGRTR